MFRSPYEETVVDGDTIRKTKLTRLQGYNSPEVAHPQYGKKADALGAEATDELKRFRAENPEPLNIIGTDRTGDRDLAANPNIAEHMVRTLHGVPAFYQGISDEDRSRIERARADALYDYRNNPNNPMKARVQALGPRPLTFNPPPDNTPKPAKGILGTLGNSIDRGVDNLQSTLFGAEHAVGRFLDSDTIMQHAQEGMARNEAEAAEHPREVESYDQVLQRDENGNIKPWESLKRAGTYATELIGENVPNLLSMAVPGGAAGLAAKTVLGKAAASTAVKQAAMAGAAAGALPGHLGEIEQEQKDLATPASFGQELLGAAVNTGLDIFSLGKGLEAMLGAKKASSLAGLVGQVAKAAGISGGTEGTTEALQEITHIALRMQQDQNYDLDNSDVRREVQHRLMESFVAGGVMGGVMGGAGRAASGLARGEFMRPEGEHIVINPDPAAVERAMQAASQPSEKEIAGERIQEPAPNIDPAQDQSIDPIQESIQPESQVVDSTTETPEVSIQDEIQAAQEVASNEQAPIETRKEAAQKVVELEDTIAAQPTPVAEQPQPEAPKQEAAPTEPLAPATESEVLNDEIRAKTLAAVQHIDKHYSDNTPGLDSSDYEQEDEANPVQEGEDLSPIEELGFQSKGNPPVRGRMIYGGNGDPFYTDASKESIPDNKIIAKVGGYQSPVGSGLRRLQTVAGKDTKLVGIDTEGNVQDVTAYIDKPGDLEAAKRDMTRFQRIIAVPADVTDLHEAVIEAAQQPEIHSLRPMADKWVVESSHVSERGANGYTPMEEAMALRAASKLGHDKTMAKTAMNKVNPDGTLELNDKGKPVTYMMDAMTLTKIGRRQDAVSTMEDATDADKRKWFLEGLTTARLHGYIPAGMPTQNGAQTNKGQADELAQSLNSLGTAGVDKQTFRAKGGVQITQGKDFADTKVEPFESDLSEAGIQGIADGTIKQEAVVSSIKDLTYLQNIVDSLPADAPVTKNKLRNLLAQAKGKAAGAKLDPTRSPAVDSVLDALTVWPNEKEAPKQNTRDYLSSMIGRLIYHQNRLIRELEDPNDTETEASRKERDLYGEFPEQTAPTGAAPVDTLRPVAYGSEANVSTERHFIPQDQSIPTEQAAIQAKIEELRGELAGNTGAFPSDMREEAYANREEVKRQIAILESQLIRENPDEYAKGDASSIPDDREDAYEKDNIPQRQKAATPTRPTATIHTRVQNHHSDKHVHGFLSDISDLLGIKSRFAVVDEDGVKGYGDSLRQSVSDMKTRIGEALNHAATADVYDDDSQLRSDMRDQLQHLLRNVPIDEKKQAELIEQMAAKLKEGEYLRIDQIPQPKQFENLSRKDWDNVKPVFSMIARVHAGDETVINDWIDYLNKADQSADLRMDTADFVAKRLEKAQAGRSKKGWIHYMDDMEYAEDRVPVIFVSKELKGTEAIRVAAHEMGHLIMRSGLQDLINRRSSDPDAREVIDQIFGKNVDWKNDKSVQDASEDFAEMVMHWVNTNKTPKTLVEKWFSKLVDQLKELWTSLTAELKSSNKKERFDNFNAFMNGLMYKAHSLGMVYEDGKLVDKSNKMMRDGKEVYIPADFRRFREAIEGLNLSETLPKRPAETMSDYFAQDIVDAVKNAGPVKSSVAGAASLFNAIRPQLASIGAELRRMDSTTAKQFARYIRVMPGEHLRKPGGDLSATIPERIEVMNARWIPKAVDALKDVPAMPLASLKRFNKDYDATVAKIQSIQDDLLMERATVNTPEAAAVRKFFNEIHDDLGKDLKIAFRKNYFPHILNPDKMLAEGASVHIKNVLMKHEGMNPKEAIMVYNRLVRTAGVPVDELIDLDSVIRANAVNAKKARKFSDETRRELAKYYEDDIHRVTLNYANSLVKRIAWQSVYGSENMEVNWNDVTKKIETVPQGGWDPLGKLRVALLKAEIGYDKNLPSAEMLSPEQLRYFRDKAIPAALGYLGSDMNPTVRKTVEYIKTALNVGLLPGAMLASLTDLAGIPVRMGDHTDARKMLRGITTMMKAATSKEAREFAEMIGIIHDAVTDHVLNSSTDSDTTRGLSGKINDRFFRVIGLKAWTDMTRVMAVAVAKMDIKDNYEKALNGDAKAVDRLARLGLTTQSVANWIQSGNEDRISDIETMPDEIIAALHRWTNQAIMRPDAMTMPPMGSDQRMRFFWYLHGFQWSYYNTTMKQVMQNIRDSEGVAKALPVVILAAASLPLVALGYELRKFVFNTVPSKALDIPDATRPKEGMDYFWELVKRWGVMGPMAIAADYRETEKRGDIAALNLLGVPTEKTIELLNDGLGDFLLHTTPLVAQSRPLRDALAPYARGFDAAFSFGDEEKGRRSRALSR